MMRLRAAPWSGTPANAMPLAGTTLLQISPHRLADLLLAIRGSCRLGLSVEALIGVCGRSPVLDPLASDMWSMARLQRVLDDVCAVKHRVQMARAVDSVFEIPEMTADRQRARQGRRNAINELHSEAKVDSAVSCSAGSNSAWHARCFIHFNISVCMQTLNLETRLVLLAESAEQKAAAEAEKKARTQAKDLDRAQVAWEIQFMKQLGYVADDAKDVKMDAIKAFAANNVPHGYAGFRNTVMPNEVTNAKNKPEHLTALMKIVRIQQPDYHWKDSKGVAIKQIVVPAAYKIDPPVVPVVVPPAAACIPPMAVPPSQPAAEGGAQGRSPREQANGAQQINSGRSTEMLLKSDCVAINSKKSTTSVLPSYWK